MTKGVGVNTVEAVHKVDDYFTLAALVSQLHDLTTKISLV